MLRIDFLLSENRRIWSVSIFLMKRTIALRLDACILTRHRRGEVDSRPKRTESLWKKDQNCLNFLKTLELSLLNTLKLPGDWGAVLKQSNSETLINKRLLNFIVRKADKTSICRNLQWVEPGKNKLKLSFRPNNFFWPCQLVQSMPRTLEMLWKCLSSSK